MANKSRGLLLESTYLMRDLPYQPFTSAQVQVQLTQGTTLERKLPAFIYACFKHSDWLYKFQQPIGFLMTVEKI